MELAWPVGMSVICVAKPSDVSSTKPERSTATGQSRACPRGRERRSRRHRRQRSPRTRVAPGRKRDCAAVTAGCSASRRRTAQIQSVGSSVLIAELVLNTAQAPLDLCQSFVEALAFASRPRMVRGPPIASLASSGHGSRVRSVCGPSCDRLARAAEGCEAIDRLMPGWVGFTQYARAGSARRECGTA